MNNDLISRSELKKAFYNQECWNCVIEHIIDNAPTVEINTNDIEYKAYCKGLEDGKKIARPQGYWDKINYGDYESPDIAIRCSKCLEEVDEESDFCPHCGCEMWRPNCVTCDHFGNCDGCEKRGEE